MEDIGRDKPYYVLVWTTSRDPRRERNNTRDNILEGLLGQLDCGQWALLSLHSTTILGTKED
jgi:hypothetical protein